MSKLYRATSLDDIAKQFRKNAEAELASMNRSIIKKHRDRHAVANSTWNAAAYMLENMEIVEK